LPLSLLLKDFPFSAVFTLTGNPFQHSTDLTANEYFMGLSADPGILPLFQVLRKICGRRFRIWCKTRLSFAVKCAADTSLLYIVFVNSLIILIIF
jgi:hypothetical protein